MNKEFENKKHTQTRTGAHTKKRNSESLRLKAPSPKQRAPGPNASDDALVVISVAMFSVDLHYYRLPNIK